MNSLIYTIFPAMRGCGLLCILIIVGCVPHASFAGTIPTPQGLLPPGVSLFSPHDTLVEAFLGIPYRADGAVDERGQYTIFADQTRVFPTPGLNCSGLVLEMSRFLLGRNITLKEAMRDRLGDSGPGSPHGEDWDFGWDILMNISEGFERRILLPGGQSLDPALATGFTPRGYDIHSAETWLELPQRLRPGHVYLVSLNSHGRRKGYGLQHYHVGIIYISSEGHAWFYQTTGKGAKVNRRDLRSAGGRDSFKKAFANTGKHRKMMLTMEVALP